MHLHPSQEEISEISYSAKLHTIFDVLEMCRKIKSLVQMVREYVFLVVPLYNLPPPLASGDKCFGQEKLTDLGYHPIPKFPNLL